MKLEKYQVFHLHYLSGKLKLQLDSIHSVVTDLSITQEDDEATDDLQN
jgi:hypothetical protein